VVKIRSIQELLNVVEDDGSDMRSRFNFDFMYAVSKFRWQVSFIFQLKSPHKINK
jgi:hypothetical protein